MKRKDLNQLWASVEDILFLEDIDKRSNLLVLLSGSRLEEVNDNASTLVISIPSEFSRTVLNTVEFKSEIIKGINKIFNSNFDLIFVDKDEWLKRDVDETTREIEIMIKPTSLNVDFTLENFIASGKGKNKMVKQAALSVSIKPGEWSPFFIYGGSGLGKTHLLHGIGNKMLESFPSYNIRYLESKDFKDLIYEGPINTQKIKTITNEFLAYDVLLIDDIQMIQSLPKAKEVFFGIFSNFINEKKQIVITSDQYPEEMKDFEERFITRFKGGVLLSVTPPDLETAKLILIQKLKKRESSGGFTLSDSALDFIASSFGSNVRELEGSINKIIFWAITNDDIKKEYNVKDMMNIFDGMTTNRGLTIQHIVQVVSKYYQIKVNDILGKSRKKEIILPRHLSIYFSRTLLNISLMDIGRYFSRDHSTIMSSIKKIEKTTLIDQKLNKVIYDLRKEIISNK